MCYKTTSDVLNMRGLAPTEKLIAAVLAHHLNVETGRCDPSISTIIEETGLGRTTIIQTISRLKSVGVLQKSGKNYQINTNIEVQNLNKKVQNLNHFNAEKVVKSSKSEPKKVQNLNLKGSKSEPHNREEQRIEQKQTKNRALEFWEKYPSSRREGKSKFQDCYRVAISKISEQQLHEVLGKQIDLWAKEKTEDRFKKYINRWLTNESWTKFTSSPIKSNSPDAIKEYLRKVDSGMTYDYSRFGMTENEARALVDAKKHNAVKAAI